MLAAIPISYKKLDKFRDAIRTVENMDLDRLKDSGNLQSEWDGAITFLNDFSAFLDESFDEFEIELKVEEVEAPKDEFEEWLNNPYRLDFVCSDCGGTFKGKLQCTETGKCPGCAGDEYVALSKKDMGGMN